MDGPTLDESKRNVNDVPQFGEDEPTLQKLGQKGATSHTGNVDGSDPSFESSA